MRNTKVSGLVVLLAWCATMLAAYWGLGGYINDTLEGIDHEAVPKWPTLLGGAIGLMSVVLTILWARGLRRAVPDSRKTMEEPASARRRFLTGTAAITGGVVGVAGATAARFGGWATVTGPALRVSTETTAADPKAEWAGATIRSYRPLGATGLMVSDVSTGSTRLHNHAEPVKFLSAMLDRGVNYIDASPDYAPQSEAIVRDAIAGRDRSKLVIASKFCTSNGHLRQGSTVQQYIQAIEGALTRMNTEYLDVAHIHSCDTVDRLMDENVHEAFDRLRDQGKARFLGVSTHTPNLEEVANTAIDSGRFGVMMLAYHHGAWPNQVEIIERAARKGVGIVAMKTLKGAKHNGLGDFRTEADSYTQAAFKWVLSNPNVSNLVISFHNEQHLDEYLYASGQSLTANDIAVLEKYDALIAGTHCFQHCGACLSTCPAEVPIHDVLRHRMYFEDYGDQKQAIQGYAKLERDASACIDCAAPCTNACPHGIPIRERMTGAHEMLTLA